ncbi:MAG: anti-sigma factor antagonist [Anaerolineae bacterium]|nr:anti-sigma factor antagonist [Anaerolineae bacterium]
MGEAHRMIIPGIQELVPDVCDFVVATARRANLNERAVYHCQMAVDEACTNIIEHGFASSEQHGGQIETICQDDAGQFTIIICDDGPPFDPTRQSDPDPNTPLTEREPGGWGVYFIKKMMDSVAYDYKDGRNCLTIAKHKSLENTSQPVGDQTQLEGAVRKLAPGIWGITPPRRLDSNTAPALQSLLDEQVAAGRIMLVIDMSAVSYISTSGLKVFVNIWRSLQAHEGRLALAGMTANVQEVFETVGFDQFFDIHPAVTGALSALSSAKS